MRTPSAIIHAGDADFDARHYIITIRGESHWDLLPVRSILDADLFSRLMREWFRSIFGVLVLQNTRFIGSIADLSALAEIRSGVQWVSLAGGGRDPLQDFWRFGGFEPFREYIKQVDALFEQLLNAIDTETAARLNNSEITATEPSRRGTTWTYITTDQPFGTWVQSV